MCGEGKGLDEFWGFLFGLGLDVFIGLGLLIFFFLVVFYFLCNNRYVLMFVWLVVK